MHEYHVRIGRAQRAREHEHTSLGPRDDIVRVEHDGLSLGFEHNLDQSVDSAVHQRHSRHPGVCQGAAGHLALVLVFNNVSTTTTCEIICYPGADLVTATGATVAHLSRTLRGTAGGEPVGVTAPQAVVLAPGASASALAEASDVPQGGITDCGSYSLLITVPNQFAAVPGGTAMLPRCKAEIHPVMQGTTGGTG